MTTGSMRCRRDVHPQLKAQGLLATSATQCLLAMSALSVSLYLVHYLCGQQFF